MAHDLNHFIEHLHGVLPIRTGAGDPRGAARSQYSSMPWCPIGFSAAADDAAPPPAEPAAMLVVTGGRVADAFGPVERVTGYKTTGLKGLELSVLIPTLRVRPHRKPPPPFTFVAALMRATGEPVTAECTCVPTLMDTRPALLVLLRRDRAAAERRLRTALDHFPGTFAVYDPQRRLLHVNRRVAELAGRSRASMLGRRDEDLFPPEWTAQYLPDLQRVIATGTSATSECRFHYRGRDVFVVLDFVPELDRNGCLRQVVATSRDVTAQRRAEQDLKSRHRQLALLYRISRLALSSRSLGEALEAAAGELQVATGYPKLSIELYDANDDTLTIAAQRGIAIPGERTRSLPAKQALSGLAVLAGTPLVEENAASSPACAGRLPAGLGAVVCVPMVHHRVIGVLSLYDAREGAAERRLVGWLQGVANFLALLVERNQTGEALRESEARLERAEAFSLIMVCHVALDGRWLKVPPRLARLLGYDEHELLQRRFQDVTHPDDLPNDCEQVARLVAGETRSFEMEKRFIRRDGRVVWAYVNVSAVLDDEGRPVHLLVYVRDITDKKHYEEQLRLTATVFNNTGDAVVIADADRHIVMVNEAFISLTGYSRAEVIGQRPALFEPGTEPPRSGEFIWQHAAKRGQWRGEVWTRRKSGEVRPELLTLTAVRDANDVLMHFVGIFRDITEIKAVQHHLERLANYDALTHLPNRNLFYDRAQHGLDKAERNGRRLALLYVDLDNFKIVNDGCGHEAGDELLQDVANRLRSAVREVDTVARLGGDEFVVLIEDLEDPTVAVETAERINRRVGVSVDVDDKPVEVTGSIGISVYPDDGRDLTTLMRNADRAMYGAKRKGRNTYQFHSGGFNSRAMHRASLEDGLHRALERDEFFVVYQPQLEVSSGRLVGAEATLRWRRPDGKVVQPLRFLPLAETSGLIVPIGQWVLNAVCRQMRVWSDQGWPLRVAVNLSPRQFRERGLVDAVLRVAADAGVDPQLLEIELTEAALVDSPDEAAHTVRRLHDAGVRLAIDDFGKGFSSMAWLHRLSVDRLKIDSSFVESSSPRTASVAAAIIAMAHQFRFRATGEGVETRQQLEFLQSQGCDEVQGFYFSKPLDAEALYAYGHA